MRAVLRTDTPPRALRASDRSAPSEVPDVRAIIAAHADPIDRNEAFNAAYQRLALGIQQVIGRAPGTLPNWFAAGAFASPQVGRSMVAAEQGLRAVELLCNCEGCTRERVFDELRLTGATRRLAETIARALDAVGPDAAATAIASFVSILIATDRATSTSALIDPRLAIAVGYRLNNLLRPSGSYLANAIASVKSLIGIDSSAKDQVLDNMAKLCRTYVSLLAEGNRAIFEDIGGSAAAFLRFRGRRGEIDPDDVLSNLRLPQSSAAGSHRVFEHALQHAFDRPPPTDFSGLAAPRQGNDLVRAAFALYTLAGKTTDLERKNAIVSHANNLIAWREQFEVVQPAFTNIRSNELDRSRVLSALTPVVQVPFSGFTWKFASFAQRRPSRDHNPLTAKPSEYDWSRFEDRWPAILDAFALTYRHADDMFRFPDPRVRS